MSYTRKLKQGEHLPEPEQPKTTRTFDFELTRTDKLFQADAIKRNLGAYWHTFGDTVLSKTCAVCDKPFKTRLKLLRYCSPTCRGKALTTI